MQLLLDIQNISIGFDGKSLLKNASLTVNPRELVIIGGPSGSGKSSFLRILNRLNNPQSGLIVFDGMPLDSFRVVELRRLICYMHQTPQMIDGTVRRNLLLPFAFRSSAKTIPPDDAILYTLLGRFKLGSLKLSDDATKLSVGEKQRVAFVRTLLLKPKILLLDEPTSALDPESKMVVEEVIEELAENDGVAAILVTHLDFRPKRIEARRYELSEGTLKELSE